MAEKLDYPQERRAAVATILNRQNRHWKASEKTLQNIDRLREGASAIVTGQQVALFGGPMFAILKALTAIKRAKEAARAGVESVPIFWLASEDHDLAEVSHATLWEPKSGLRDFFANTNAPQNVPVGAISFGAEMEALAQGAAQMLPDPDMAGLLRECYCPGATFTDAFARLFARLFADFGLILLDPSDGDLHKTAQPLFVNAVERAAELNAALLERGKTLENSGYHAQVKVTASSTLLFALNDGERTAVHRSNGHFAIGKEKLESGELIARVAAHPDRFSANALFRPVVQDFLLPTLAYIGGPAEVAYFAQSEVIYKNLLDRVTPILPRCSASLIGPQIDRMLKKYGLAVTDAWQPADQLQKMISSRCLPAELSARFADAKKETESQLTALTERLKQLDPTLEDAAQRAQSKMLYQLSRLMTRAANAAARRSSDIVRHSSQISDLLYPHKDLQERTIAGISFLGIHGPGLLQQMFDTMDAACPGHQLLYL